MGASQSITSIAHADSQFRRGLSDSIQPAHYQDLGSVSRGLAGYLKALQVVPVIHKEISKCLALLPGYGRESWSSILYECGFEKEHVEGLLEIMKATPVYQDGPFGFHR
jgi:hypothetical protein